MLGQVDEVVADLAQEVPAIDVLRTDGEADAVLRPVGDKGGFADFGQLDGGAANRHILPVGAVDAAEGLGRHLSRVGDHRAHGELGALLGRTIARGIAKVGDRAADDEALLQLEAGAQRKVERMDGNGLNHLAVARSGDHRVRHADCGRYLRCAVVRGLHGRGGHLRGLDVGVISKARGRSEQDGTGSGQGHEVMRKMHGYSSKVKIIATIKIKK